MHVPFTLHKLDRPEPATAVLLLSENSAELLDLCARIAAEASEGVREWPALPPIHAVAGGFLVKLGRPIVAVFPGTIRLRSLAANLLLPADAELVPTLLNDEAAGLVRDRGLIFLPGGRILAFALDQRVTADTLLTLPRLAPRQWRSFPTRPARPQRLEEILLDLPDETANGILDSGGADIGVEAPRPADAGPIARAAGKTVLGVGQGLAWLGQMLHLPGLSKLGASLAGSAMRSVPRLSESLLGKQEAALRELLRKFRSGNLEEALRHALPLSNSPGRGGRPAADARLPTNSLFYRLFDLLSSAQGQASSWFGPADVHAELTREYNKAAEAATARGDYRRAAFIYGRLLHDYRRAAAVLARGGLHHDAAILYLEVLRDNLAAARAFEAAGETDRALHLYQQRGEHLLAADLLRRLGQEEEAVSYYLRAADQLAATENHLAAAELLLTRAQRPDLALRYLVEGWARRPRGSALPCLLRLAQWHAEQDEQQQLLSLVAEAEEFFEPPANEHGASQFFNLLAQLAGRDNLAAIRADLRDRALSGLAAQLRCRVEREARPGIAISQLFSRSGGWKAPVISDADFALRAAFKKKQQPPKKQTSIAPQRIRLDFGQVSAVCAARATGRLFLGFATGRIAWFDPGSESVVSIPSTHSESTILSLATNDHGDQLIALSAEPEHQRFLVRFTVSEKSSDCRVSQPVSCFGPAWLTPLSEAEGQSIVGFWNGERLTILWANDLLPWRQDIPAVGDEGVRIALIFLKGHPDLGLPDGSFSIYGCLFLGDSLRCFGPPVLKGTITPFQREMPLGWHPGSQLRGLCSPPPLSWHWRPSGPLELAGIDEDDSIHWTEVDYRDPANPILTGGASTAQANYRAAALVRSGLIAGVYPGGVDWLRRHEHRLLPSSATLVALEDVIACVPSPPTHELLVLCRDTSVMRVPLPS